MLDQTPTNLTLGLFGLLTVFTTTVVPLWLANRRKTADYEEQRKIREQEFEVQRKTKEQDWARQDRVAAQTAETARLLLAANERVANTSSKMDEKLNVIHTLVNSKMTEEMQERLEETERSLISLQEIVGLKEAAGHESSPDALGVIKATKERIIELKSRLNDRYEQQKKIDEQSIKE